MHSKLAEILVSADTCSSSEEAEVIAEIVLEFDDDGDTTCDVEDHFSSTRDCIVENLIDNLGIDEAQAKAIFLELKRSIGYVSSDDDEYDDSEDDDSVVESASLNLSNIEDGENDAEYLLDGECELCDRYIKLTRHHLIPKTTWPRMQTTLLQAAKAEENGDRERALLILGHGLEGLLDDNGNRSHAGGRFCLSTNKAAVRAILHDTCSVCRECHSTIHRTHTNMELASDYNTVEKLLGDERISKFCKWASKQKRGKYKRIDCDR